MVSGRASDTSVSNDLIGALVVGTAPDRNKRGRTYGRGTEKEMISLASERRESR